MSDEPRACPLCPEETGPQPAENFGICRARKDGRNLYCRGCIRQKVNIARAGAREYKRRLAELKKGKAEAEIDAEIERSQGPVVGGPPHVNITPRETREMRVLGAIKRGHGTQTRIGADTKLTNDEVGLALANLLLWDRTIRTRTRADGERIYELASPRFVLPAIGEAVSPRQPDARSTSRSASLVELIIRTA